MIRPCQVSYPPLINESDALHQVVRPSDTVCVVPYLLISLLRLRSRPGMDSELQKLMQLQRLSSQTRSLFSCFWKESVRIPAGHKIRSSVVDMSSEDGARSWEGTYMAVTPGRVWLALCPHTLISLAPSDFLHHVTGCWFCCL